MVSREISLDGPPARRAYALGLDRLALIPIIVGILTAASILLLIYQENRAVQYRFEATEVWFAYQVKIVQTTSEADPNLKAQYTEEQDVLRQHIQGLRGKLSTARHSETIFAYASLLLLLGAATSVFALAAKSTYTGYVGLLLGIIGVGFGIRALF
jgi:hypothetical protein